MLSNKDIRKMSLEEVARISEPYSDDLKKLLMEKISGNEELQRQYEKSPKLEEFLARAEEVGKVYFVINFESRKTRRFSEYPNVRVYVGMRERVPIIALQI